MLAWVAVVGAVGQSMEPVAETVFGAVGQSIAFAAVAAPVVERAATVVAAATAIRAMRFMAGSSVSIPCSLLGNLLPRSLAIQSRESLGNELTYAQGGREVRPRSP
jgi:hypothetical protein